MTFAKNRSFVAAAFLFGVSFAQAQTPSIKSGGVVSASAFGQFTSIAPSSWIEIYGSNLAAGSRSWAGTDFTGVNAPTSLDGTKVTIGGQAAFIAYISPTQVNAQVPSNVGIGSQQVVVTTAVGSSAPYNVTVNAEQPGLLAPASFNIAGKQYVGALFSDGAYALPPGSISGLTSRRAKPGDAIALYGVGFGPVTANIPAGQIVQANNSLVAAIHVFFGQTEATVSYDGLAPGAVGLYQFNVIVPNVPTSDLVPLTFTLGGISGTQTLYIPVQNGAITSQIQSLTLSPTSVAGGGSVTGLVVLTAPAPAGGAVVALSSSSGVATMPSNVTVPAGSASAGFTVSTGTVSSNQSTTITAMYAGSSAQATLTVTPPAAPTFRQLLLYSTFSATGYPSSQVPFFVTPNNGVTTFTATTRLLTFVDCAASNGGAKFTCSSLGLGLQAFSAIGYPTLFEITSASLQFTLSPGAAMTPFDGTLSGSLSVTGTVDFTGPSVTISGPLSGNYLVAQ